MSIRFAGPGDDVYLRDLNDPSKKLKQILWGDFLNVVEETPDLLKVSWGKDKTGNPVHFWVRRQDTQAERLLELVFVDVGQGDGCLLVVPLADGSERLMLVDAGEGDNMLRFLLWRFGKFRNDFHFHAAVITHPDQDHYLGFQKLFELPTVHVDNVYHNGIGERQGADPLGPLDAARRHLVDLVASHADAQALYGGAIDQGGKRYARLMRTALQSGRVGNVQMLSTATALIENGRAWMPGFSPATNADATIEVLGPVVEPDAAGQPRLRTFGASISAPAMDVGKTKNGHSVLLRLSYRGLSLLLGGDLNRPAENFLLRHYAGIAAGQPLSAAVQGARARFQSDVMKSCHHGATDVTDEFLQAVNPFAFVVSSGDEESHVHPRPDLLGRLGKQGRGQAPLLLSTELLRSTREAEAPDVLGRITRLDEKIEAAIRAGTDPAPHQASRLQLLQQLTRRNVEVYGAISLRSDGRRLVIAFLMERPRGVKRWQTYWYRHQGAAGFVPEPG